MLGHHLNVKKDEEVSIVLPSGYKLVLGKVYYDGFGMIEGFDPKGNKMTLNVNADGVDTLAITIMEAASFGDDEGEDLEPAFDPTDLD